MPYNEIHTANGIKRPAYVALESRLGRSLSEPLPHLASRLHNTAVAGSVGIHALPLVVGLTDLMSTLVPGALQRAFALQQLFADIAFEGDKIGARGLVSNEVLEGVLRSEGTELSSIRRVWESQSPDQIRFVYGPDVVRDSAGRWVVLEDNIGCLGGVVEGRLVLEAYLNAAGLEMPPSLQEHGVLKAMRNFFRRTGLRSRDSGLFGIPGTTLRGAELSCEATISAKSELLRSLGIIVQQPDTIIKMVYGSRQAVSAIVNLSTTMSAAYLRLIDETFVGQNTPVFGGPYLEVVASKSFHALGDKLVSLCLRQKPLLATPRTELLMDTPATLPKEGVLKRSSGCAGTDVYMLNEIENHDELYDKIDSWGPCGAVIQEQIAPSVLALANSPVDPVSVEIRPIVYVTGWRTAVVDNIVSGRATKRESGTLGDSRLGRRHLPVLVENFAGAE